MELLLLTVIATFICFALVFFIKQKQYSHPTLKYPYQLKAPLMDEEERQLLEELQRSVGHEYYVLSKIRLPDAVNITAVPRRSYWHHAYNRIASEHFDFLLCRKRDLTPACAVILDRDEVARDPFMDELCRIVGLPLARLPAQAANSFGEVQDFIERAISLRDTDGPKLTA
ncbi:DUF2726 domain-containing protein [Stutzerimonas tarimensis]|uniref:DUF2726 domain-containing protein n=1 Tax=Stutzerimonas tarimensis TaxID=1507735 RepID=A0ABV7T148_9GAMM